MLVPLRAPTAGGDFVADEVNTTSSSPPKSSSTMLSIFDGILQVLRGECPHRHDLMNPSSVAVESQTKK